MTTTDTEVTITQADRDAADAYYAHPSFMPLPERFARHRTLTPTQAAGPVLLEALKVAMKVIEDDRGLDGPICCSGYMCACQGSSHRQLLLHDLSEVIAQAEGPQA